MRMLIVEDSPETADLLTVFMKMKGHSAHVAKDVDEAIQYIKDNIYDVVILDHCLPGTDGLQFLKNLRHVGYREHDTNCRRVPVVIATAVDPIMAGTIRSELENLQPAGLLTKPYDPDELMVEIQNVRNPRRQPS